MSPSESDTPSRPSASWRPLVGGAVATVVVGFVVGFALGGRSTGPDETTAAGPTPSSSSTTTTAPTTTSGPTTTAPTSTTMPSTTSTTVVTTTVAPTTTAVVTTVPTTAAPVTTTAPVVAPSRVVVSYATDGRGRFILPRVGSANLVITNEGGLAQQWLVTGTGFTTAGPSQGSLGAGQTVTVIVVAPPGELPTGEINGTISVLGAVNSNVPFVIPPA